MYYRRTKSYITLRTHIQIIHQQKYWKASQIQIMALHLQALITTKVSIMVTILEACQRAALQHQGPIVIIPTCFGPTDLSK